MTFGTALLILLLLSKPRGIGGAPKGAGPHKGQWTLSAEADLPAYPVSFAEFAVGASLFGILLTHLTHQYGGSEIYFLLAAYPFAAAGVFAAANSFRFGLGKKRRAALLLCAVFAVVSAAISIAPALSFYGQTVKDASHYAVGSPGRIDDEYKLMAIDYKRFDFITEKEYEAMLWLKTNTKKDAVVISDRVILNNKYMYGTAFSERVFFLEGYVYITSYDEDAPYYGEIEQRLSLTHALYEGDAAALSEIKAFGVEFLCLSKWQHPELRFGEEVVFENEDIIVYRL